MPDEDDRAAYVRSLIAARCPEIDLDDLPALTHASMEPSAETLPVEITEQVLDVVDHMMDRLDTLEARVEANGEDDDGERRRAG
jgi:hypothetical protein